VEMVYTKFASLISSDPIVQTMLPLTPAGEICDVDGNCVDPDEDELFKLTTKSGELTLEREKVNSVATQLVEWLLEYRGSNWSFAGASITCGCCTAPCAAQQGALPRCELSPVLDEPPKLCSRCWWIGSRHRT